MNHTTISHIDDEELARKCAHIAKRLSGWYTVKDLANKYNTSSQVISMRLNRWQDHGGELQSRYGLSGRYRLSVRLTPQLAQYMERLSPAQDKGEG